MWKNYKFKRRVTDDEFLDLEIEKLNKE